MALETNRKMSVRRITAPGDDSTYVDLKVIDSIMFVDPKQHYQEWELSFENNPDAARKSHVVEVGEEKLKVERIDALNSIHNSGGRWQEWSTEYENGEQTPVHYRTHNRKIYHRNKDGSKDESVWIEVQRIDAIWFKDPKEHYQERVWELVWPDNEDEEWDYQGLTEPVTDWDKTSINPPWRIDPFQTIVDCSLGARYMLVLYQDNKIAYAPMANVTNPTGKMTTKTLASSNWSRGYSGAGAFSDMFHTSQLKLSKTVHALMAPFKISSEGVITSSNTQRHVMYNSLDTILRNDDCAEYITWWEYANIIMNGSGNVVYNNLGDKFEFSAEKGIKRTSYKPEGYFNSWSSWYGQQVVSAVDDTGRLYSDVGQTEIDELYVGLSNRGAITQAQYDATPTDYGFIDLISYGPGESEVTRSVFDEGGGSPPYSGSVSGVGYMMVHSKDAVNKLDKMTVSSCSPTLSIVSDSFGLFNTRENLTGYYGYTADTVPNVWENQPQGRPYSSKIQAFPFPYASALSNRKMYMKGSQIGFSIIPNFGVYERTQYNVFLDTPYERFFLGSGVYNSNTQPIATDHEIYPYGWLHVSNGVNVLQAYIVQSLDYGDKRKMWLDGADYGDKLAGAIGCDINDIRTVLFDIKKSDIDKLK